MFKAKSPLALLILLISTSSIFQAEATEIKTSAGQTKEALENEIDLLHAQMQQMQVQLLKLEKKYQGLQQTETVLAKYTMHHNKMQKLMLEKGRHTSGPELVFSGNLSIDAFAGDRSTPIAYSGTGANSLKLSNAQLNANATVAPWARGYISVNDDFGSSTATTGDELEFEQAYVQFGHRESPILFNLGKQYLPFGVYKHHPVTASLTQELSEFVKEAAVFGYKHKKFFSSAYIFQGQGSVSGHNKASTEKLNHNYGIEIGTTNRKDQKFGYETSLGYIANLAEARNITITVPKTSHVVGNLAPHLDLYFGKLNFVFDYTYATRAFSQNDIAMNGKPARPRAFATEMHYHFLTNKHPSTFSLGYQKSWDSLFLNMAKQRYITSYDYYFNQYVVLQFELMHNKDYGSNDQATYFNSSGAVATVAGTGKSSNSGTMRVSMHF